MAPKKPNGFMIFTFEWKQKNGQHMNIAQATSAAGEIWKKMGPKQREQYTKRAQAAPPTKESQKREKMTCIGTPLDYIEKERFEMHKAEENMMKSIEKTIRLAVDGGRLENQKFHFIMINYFTRLLNSNVYVPAEIAIVEFSLLEGVTRKYHTYVNPKIDLYGNVYEAQNHADTTHNLPLPPNAKGETDLRKIFGEIMSFVWNSNSDMYYPVYTHNDAMNYVRSALNFLSDDSDNDDNEILDLEVFSIQELFHALKCTICEKVSIDKPRNRFISDAILKRDAFEYANNIACDFHEEIDRSNYCCLSQVYRWGFSFADYMAKDLSITFIPGRHMPGTVNANVVMNGTISCTDDKSMNSFCGAMSILSMESKYLSCDGYDQPPSSSHNKSLNHPVPKSTASKTSRANELFMELYADSELDYKPSRRADDSKPPGCPSFAIGYCEDEAESSIASSSLSRGRGRGIMILDDYEFQK